MENTALAIISKRSSQVLTEMHQAETCLKQAERKYLDLRARWEELISIEQAVKRAMEEGPEEQVDSDTQSRVSELIRTALFESPAGFTVQQISEVIGVRRQTVSATLYNMKKRGEVEHAETTGLYKLAIDPMLGVPFGRKHMVLTRPK